MKLWNDAWQRQTDERKKEKEEEEEEKGEREKMILFV